MYFIWILVGMPLASLLCAAFITMRDGKVTPANAALHRTQPAGEWNSESTLQVLIGILGSPRNDGFRVTIRQRATRLNDARQRSKYLAKSDDKALTRSNSEVWTLGRYGELLPVDKNSSPAEAGLVQGNSGNLSSDTNVRPHRPIFPQKGGYDYENRSRIATN
jgi:hypothetical protein